MRKNLTEMKIFLKVLGGYFFETPVKAVFTMADQYKVVLSIKRRHFQ